MIQFMIDRQETSCKTCAVFATGLRPDEDVAEAAAAWAAGARAPAAASAAAVPANMKAQYTHATVTDSDRHAQYEQEISTQSLRQHKYRFRTTPATPNMKQPS